MALYFHVVLFALVLFMGQHATVGLPANETATEFEGALASSSKQEEVASIPPKPDVAAVGEPSIGKRKLMMFPIQLESTSNSYPNQQVEDKASKVATDLVRVIHQLSEIATASSSNKATATTRSSDEKISSNSGIAPIFASDDESDRRKRQFMLLPNLPQPASKQQVDAAILNVATDLLRIIQKLPEIGTTFLKK